MLVFLGSDSHNLAVIGLNILENGCIFVFIALFAVNGGGKKPGYDMLACVKTGDSDVSADVICCVTALFMFILQALAMGGVSQGSRGKVDVKGLG